MNAWVVPGYVHERVLGYGASGRVVAAVARDSGDRVAIKYLAPGLTGSRSFLTGFRQSARILKSLDVPQVARVFDYVEEPGAGAAVVMELVDGISIHEMISRHGAIGPEAALAVLKESLAGLAAAHALGVLHEDYKPQNVLVDGQGNSKLTDFGMAVKEDRRVPSAGSLLYMAPELWEGTAATPATDIYAATAVFFECLTGHAPFSGSLGQLRYQHLFVAVPVDQVGQPLRRLIARGTAKYPSVRPRDAAAFAAEVEETAVAAYGPDWEARGRSQLAGLSAAAPPPPLPADTRRPLPARARRSLPASPRPALPARTRPALLAGTVVAAGTGGAAAASWLTRHRKAAAVSLAATVAVVVGIATTAIALSGGGQHTAQTASSLASSSASSPASASAPPVVMVNASFQAIATVVPPAAVSSCAAPTKFTYSSDITASAAGTVSYRWVYSSGKTSGVDTLAFAAAGTKQVAGGAVRVKAAGTGWAELQIVKPAGAHSDKATYRLLCRKPGSRPGQVTATAAVTPANTSVTCGTAPPVFTFTGTISTTKAGLVSYYWALSDGTSSPLATLRFGAPGIQAVPPFTVTAPADTATGAAELVVTSPVPAVSNTATYTLSCVTRGGGGHSYPALAITTSTLPGATEGKAYSADVSASGGHGSYTWTASGLPAGLGINAGTGTISGTPTGAGTSEVTVTATDPVAQRATRTLRLAVSNLVYPTLGITTAALPAGTVGTAYTTTLAATGGHGAYTWSATGLPAGLGIDAGTGTISGTPTAGGTSDITVAVKDSETAPQKATATLDLTIAYPAIAITTAALPAGAVGTAYTVTLAATGGDGDYTWAATGLPAGLAIDGATIAGTPTAGGTSDVMVTVTDGETPAETATVTLDLTIAYPALAISTAALPAGAVGTAYTVTLAATGGDGDYTWAAAPLPAGLAIDATTGVIAGTPTAGGTTDVAVTVTDGEAPAATATVTLDLTIAYPAIAITTAALPDATVGTAYTVTLAATGGNGDYTWSVNALPDGLTLNADTGVISGTPATGDDADSPYTIDVTVTDSEAPAETATVAFTLTVDAGAGGATPTATATADPTGTGTATPAPDPEP